jgi:hypothetical protein
MNVRDLAIVVFLLALASSLATALVRHEGVGAFEYVVGIAIVAGLVALALRHTRRVLQSR